jgi:hypothetical protein
MSGASRRAQGGSRRRVYRPARAGHGSGRRPPSPVDRRATISRDGRPAPVPSPPPEPGAGHRGCSLERPARGPRRGRRQITSRERHAPDLAASSRDRRGDPGRPHRSLSVTTGLLLAATVGWAIRLGVSSAAEPTRQRHSAAIPSCSPLGRAISGQHLRSRATGGTSGRSAFSVRSASQSRSGDLRGHGAVTPVASAALRAIPPLCPHPVGRPAGSSATSADGSTDAARRCSWAARGSCTSRRRRGSRRRRTVGSRRSSPGSRAPTAGRRTITSPRQPTATAGCGSDRDRDVAQ